MEQFRNIKRVCRLISRLNAQAIASQFGFKYPEENDLCENPIAGCEKKIKKIIDKRGLEAPYGPVMSGCYNRNDEWIDFIAMNQIVIKAAPELKTILNEVGRTFNIEIGDQGSLNIVGEYNREIPDLVDDASYFVNSNIVYAVNIAEKEIIKINGDQKGVAGKNGESAYLELNVEIVPDLDTVIHEILHLKLPKEISHSEKTVDLLCKELSAQLSKYGLKDFVKSDKVQEERIETLKAFDLLDADLESIL